MIKPANACQVIIIMMSTQNKRTDNSANQFRKYQSGEAYNFEAGNMWMSIQC